MKKVNCIYWKKCPRLGGGGGCCQLEDGRNPSYVFCEKCDEKTEKIQGLGDTITKAIHIVTLGKLKQKSDCGCNKRRKTLNKMFPYKRL